MTTEAVVIVAAKRTPMGGFMGALSGAHATDLGATAIKSSLEQAGLSADKIDEVIMGCVLPAGLGQAPARQAMLKAGLNQGTGATTINKVCGSGLKAAMFAHDLIKSGSINSAVAGGMESMSNAPYMLPNARSGMRMGHGEVKDHMMCDGLEDAYDNKAMGCFAQDTADQYSIGREQMDNFALSSLTKANSAIETGAFANEIAAHTISTRKGDVTVAIDEQPGNARPDKIPGLRPAFKKDGTITAANSSSISDGAAALVLMRESDAKAQGLTPLCRIVAHSTHSQAPSEFTLAPVGAMQSLLEKAGWSVNDVDLWEINEAFASVAMRYMRDLDIGHDITNVVGGSIAMGHPLGATGAMILGTLLDELERREQKYGLATLCVGGGMGIATIIERV